MEVENMEIFKQYKSLIIASLIFVLLTITYYFIPIKFKDILFISFTTFFVGIFVIYLYIKQKIDYKEDVARIILQEIRRAEDIISDYKKSGGYEFAKKIIATNNWNKNIHLFVGDGDLDLNTEELDKISDLYSNGEYLDILIKEISNITLNNEIEIDKKLLEVQLKYQNQQQIILEGSTYPIAQVIDVPKTIRVDGIRPVWKNRLDIISKRIEPIYHSTIVSKLKKIAKVK